jgi:type II secretion system protein N
VRRAAALALACLLVTAFFFALRFPYDRFRAPLAAQLAAATGAAVELGELSGRPGPTGLTLRAAPVRLRWPPGEPVELEGASLRPAWSLSWLRGRPALHVDLEARAGRASGTLWPGPPLALSARVRGLALEALPPELLARAEGFALTGRLDAEADLSGGNGGALGDLVLEVQDGAASAPGAPLAVPFERLRAELTLEEGGGVRLRSAALEGPMVLGSAEGRLGPGPSWTQAPLDLRLDLQVADPSLRSVLAPLGIRLDGQGRTKLQLRGTLAAPELR